MLYFRFKEIKLPELNYVDITGILSSTLRFILKGSNKWLKYGFLNFF